MEECGHPCGFVDFQLTMGTLFDDLLFATCRNGVKFTHNIQTIRLFLKKWVVLAWVFICIRDGVAKQGVLHWTCLP